MDGEGAAITGGALIPGTMTWAMASAVDTVQHSPVQSSIFEAQALSLGNAGDFSAQAFLVRRYDPIAAFPLRRILAVSSNRIFLTSALGGQGSVMRSGSTDCPETCLWRSACEDMRANVTARWTVH
jgi:hypothetical protein